MYDRHPPPQPDASPPDPSGNGQPHADTPPHASPLGNTPAINPTSDRKFHRPTREEMEKYLIQVGEWVAAGVSIWEMHRRGKEKFGWSWKTTARYVSRVRKRAAKVLNAKEPGQLVAEQWDKLNKVIYDHCKSGMVCVAAIREQNALMGLHKPLKVAQTTAEGKDLYTAAIDLLSEEELKQIDLIGRKLETLVAKQKRLEGTVASGGSNGRMIDVVPVKRDEGEGEGEGGNR